MNSIVAARRKADHQVADIFLERWSPRAMSGEEVEWEALMSLFEAARWAPSSYNNQPWRFVYCRRSEADWQRFLGLLADGNKAWAKDAGALVVVCSRKVFDFNGQPSRTHHFDAGAAWAYLALQGSLRGLVVHGMEGFDYDRARSELGVPDDFDIEAMIAVGKPGEPSRLPESLRRVEKPSGRKPLSDTVFAGRFK